MLAIKGLRQHLSSPEMIAAYVDAYNAERKRLKKEANAERTRMERRLGEIEREIKRIVDFIVKGTATDALIPRMNELEAERKTLAARLEEAKETDNVVTLHPKALDRYKRAVMELANEFKHGTPTEFATVRELVTAIIVHASPSRPGGAGTKANAEDDRSVRIEGSPRRSMRQPCPVSQYGYVAGIVGSGGATRTPTSIFLFTVISRTLRRRDNHRAQPAFSTTSSEVADQRPTFAARLSIAPKLARVSHHPKSDDPHLLSIDFS
ncbi:hypothetical protein [Bradyrhizobium sp. CB3481]|uniref:hypothetical protein n=1 Tax=Bradyrhizobium sp. CB3481 TaxID=3039158 RepID=UPI0024B1A563|nr:hypothetical protein [Bradyrhizobium sp. CB3481]WFU19410.1 hypothetical protein QA643_14290 [Bradyrhizobium sp. CB3481]